jgi:hypothetical protein
VGPSSLEKGVEKIQQISIVIAGFVLVQSPPQDPQILRNYGRTYHCHLSRNFLLEYNGCAHFTIDNITIVTQP